MYSSEAVSASAVVPQAASPYGCADCSGGIISRYISVPSVNDLGLFVQVFSFAFFAARLAVLGWLLALWDEQSRYVWQQ